MSEVTDLINRVGKLTLDVLAERFRSSRWPRTPPPLRPSNYWTWRREPKRIPVRMCLVPSTTWRLRSSGTS